MRNSIIIFLFSLSTFYLSAQNIDYNTKKGYAANGYDVVTYFSNKAVEGNKAFTTTFKGIKYKFSSKENLQTFSKNPEKYAPQYGGYCAYAIAVNNKKVSIDPETFQIKNGKLLLFYNSWGTNTLKLWNKENPDVLFKKADKNWEAIKFKK